MSYERGRIVCLKEIGLSACLDFVNHYRFNNQYLEGTYVPSHGPLAMDFANS